jgi:hypothetical protein
MATKKHQRKTSKPLLREVSFGNQQMTVKRKIDLLINDMGFTVKENVTGLHGREYACRLIKGTKKYVFDRKAEIEYIDQLLSGKKLSTTPTSTIPAKQNLKKGAIAKGPSHKNGGIKAEIKGKQVAEIEGGEIVINKIASEKHCETFSKLNQSAGGGVAFDCSKKTQMEEDVVFAKHGARLCSESTETQTLLFDKKIFSLEYAMDWIYRHNYKNATDVDETENKYRFRQQEPSKFKKDSFRTIHFGDGIEAVIGCPIKKAERGAQVSPCGCHSADNETQYAAKGAVIGTKKTTIAHQEAYNINKEIELLIDKNGEDTDKYTSEEKNRLRFYSGYGGIVSEDITLEQAKQSFTEYYTPDLIVQRMWDLARKNGFIDGHSVLEPSVATGQFLKYVPEQSMATGYEINKYSYTICKILYPKFNLFLQPFEEIFIKNRDSIKSKISDLPKYNLVIGNPPYGYVGGFGMGMGEKSYTKASNWVEYFLVRGLDLTLPGGLLIYIIGTEVANGGIPFLQQGPSKTKEMIAERADLIDAYRLPNGVFDRTDVLTDILVFKHK